jgi:drug/metabolite transporter (DMT)-like permease
MIDEAQLRRPGVVTLLTAALGQSADLVQTEFRLVRAEMAEKLTAMRGGLVMMAAGAILLIAAIGMLLQAAVGALIALGMSPPLAILLVAGGAAVIGFVLFFVGQKRLEPSSLAPERTIDSLSADSRMVKETLS